MHDTSSNFSRQVVILTGNQAWREQQYQQIIQHYPTQSILCCASRPPAILHQQLQFFPFNNSRNVLGQEFSLAIFDATEGEHLAFHLDTLTILAATLKAGGCLFLLLPNWQTLTTTPDQDSLRWNSADTATTTPQFIAWLKQKIDQYDLKIYSAEQPLIDYPKIQTDEWQLPRLALQEQQQCLHQLLQPQVDIYLLMAGRGRGKSALAGQFIQQLITRQQRVLVTAANQQAITTLKHFAAPQHIEFIAPDALNQQLAQATIKEYDWLIVDEAAMLPLSLLQRFCKVFPKVLLATTSEGYEGTGQGFRLKLEQQLDRCYHYLTLTIPLRWPMGDRLECWVNDIALLVPQLQSKIPYQPTNDYQFLVTDYLPISEQLIALYQLLSLAHYRTSPTDFRRLLDGNQQRFIWCEVAQQPVGVVWGLIEGGIENIELIEGICQGYRRPKGNLVAQALAFQLNQRAAVQLRSLRISRIAVAPQWQHHGIGTALIQQLQQRYRHQQDFLSVSFGYSKELLAFWQRVGFQVVGLSQGTEASSGNYSVMMVYPLSEAGDLFCQQAMRKFGRDLPLMVHPLCVELSGQLGLSLDIDWQLTADDRQSLSDFVTHQRTVVVSYPALRRLLYHYPDSNLQQQLKFLIQPFQRNQKQRLIAFKQQLANFLQKN
ncbi:hypothetical protein QV06_08425 [Gallibacterium genomosp. 3]|uniref:tRNA(Met) cytidine acetyltransferase TmcA n=1 Tax=Gallibacterium genomosp. 3 TaxID=505345 RepID=A0A1A7PQA6_9PAST|nr:GNAT family N-acetyltransferase [Gallibacterium genomosp. 3]OBX03897.1 hypothetical protein QV06_08425 [Gallibacterium genomosp. 3]